MGELDRVLREGASLHDAGRYDEALALYDRAAACWPNLALLWNNRGNTLLEMQRWPEAADSYQRALKLAPGLHDARVALASCLQALGHVREALASCDAVLRSEPQHAEAHWNRALLLLLLDNYAEGFREYEWRWRKRRFTSPQRAFEQPRWRGEALQGKTILIYAEQGLGDTIQFARYLPQLVELGGQVLFECHPQLTRLMSTLGEGITVVPFDAPLPDFDLQLPLLSLPHVCATTFELIPADLPYLAPPSAVVPFWQSVLPQRHDALRRVGLCWSGRAYPDPGRSVPPQLLAPLAACPGLEFYSLQLGEVERPPLPLVDLTMLITDFADTAALIAQLDLVITIDTSVAHLAGALGKEVWVMLPFAPDWRWGLVRETCPWYPTARLFRHNHRNDWQDPIMLVADCLTNPESC